MDYRTGLGTDLHILTEGRPLIIGGIKIPYHKGCLGHSDADVLIHALCDAILGAMAMRDIGCHFPDSDKKYKDIDSSILLAKVVKMAEEKGYKIVNIDSVVHLEKPKLLEHIPEICKSLANVCQIDVSCVNVKAKTSESIGEIGQGKAVQAMAIVLLKRE